MARNVAGASDQLPKTKSAEVIAENLKGKILVN